MPARIIKLKKGNYCANFGDRSCTDDEVRAFLKEAGLFSLHSSASEAG